MSNNIDRQYLELVEHILRFGYDKQDRTGTGTKSIFGWQIRHRMSEGFPLLTTKKMAWKTMVTELLWFLRGDTNIKYLVNNDCHIWDGDAYKNYLNGGDVKWLKQMVVNTPLGEMSVPIPYTQEEFINKIKTDDEFAKKWGELGPIYGKQWRSWRVGKGIETSLPHPDGGNIYEAGSMYIDQIANIINLLKTDPDSRRMIVNAYNVGELDQMVLPPCHMMFQFYTRELSLEERLRIADKFNPLIREDCLTKTHHPDETEELKLQYRHEWLDSLGPNVVPQRRAISLRWDQRSNDIGLGSPINVSSYSLLLMIIAKQVNMLPEEIIGHLGDCHIYNNHLDGLKEQLTRIPYELPTVRISDRVVNDISEYTIEDFTLENYVSHPKIYLPLSN